MRFRRPHRVAPVQFLSCQLVTVLTTARPPNQSRPLRRLLFLKNVATEDTERFKGGLILLCALGVLCGKSSSGQRSDGLESFATERTEDTERFKGGLILLCALGVLCGKSSSERRSDGLKNGGADEPQRTSILPFMPASSCVRVERKSSKMPARTGTNHHSIELPALSSKRRTGP